MRTPKKKHEELCLCRACTRRLLKRQDAHLAAWMRRVSERLDELERENTRSIHYFER